MSFGRSLFWTKVLFLAVNILAASLLCWEVSPRARVLVLALPLVWVSCLLVRGLVPHLLAAFGAGLIFFGFQSYSVQAQVLHLLTGWVCLLVVCLPTVRGGVPAWAAEGGSTSRAGLDGPVGPGPLRLWLAGFTGLMLAGLPLLPFGEFFNSFQDIGFQGFVRLTAYSNASSPFYALAAMDRLVLYALLAWELARPLPTTVAARSRPDDRPAALHALAGAAASLPAALVFGLAEYFLARGKAFAMSDRLTSLFLNPGWFGEYVCLAMPLLLPLARGRGRLVFLAVWVLALAAMVFTMARAAWMVSGLLALACAVAALSAFDLPAVNVRRLAKGAALGLAGMAVLVGVVFGALTVSKVSLLNFPLATMIAKRLERFAETPRPTVFLSGLLVGGEAPLAGMGFETYAWHYPALMETPGSALAREIPREAEVFEATHNLFIQVFAGGGLLGLAAWLLLAGRAFQLAWRVHRLRADPWSLAVLLALAGFHLFGLFQEMIYIPAVWLLFLLLVAWCLHTEDRFGGWVAPFTRRRAARAVSLAVLLALTLHLANAGYAAVAARHGLEAYPPPGAPRTSGFSAPEAVDGRTAAWSSGASSLVLQGPGPWSFETYAPHPDLNRPVRVWLIAGGRILAEATFDAVSGRRARLTIPAGEARPGQRAHLVVDRVYFPIVSGAKDHRALGLAVSGPGVTP